MARQSQEDKAAEIITLVTEHETATRNLRDRFESDYGMYLLDQSETTLLRGS
jgi:hypothetical protein